MTDNKQVQNTDDSIQLEEKAESMTQPNLKNDTNSPKKKNTALRWLLVTSLFTSVAALSSSGWLYYQSTQSRVGDTISLLSAQQANLAQQFNRQNNTNVQLNNRILKIQSAEQAFEQQKAAIIEAQSNQNNQILSLEAKINRLNNTSKEDWKLAEAEYLIRLANQRLLLESDIGSAETLLSNADDILNELQDPITFTTRKALAKDIQALKAISKFDLEGYYLQLSALYDNVETLPQREPSKKWQAANTKDSSDATHTATGKIETTLASLWKSISSLVIINYDHKPIKALLPPAEYQELITGIQLQLDVAQVALLKGEPIIYEKALSRVAQSITERFDTKAANVVSFLSVLTQLQQVNPAPELPLPRESLIAMKALMTAWINRTSSDSVSPEAIKETTPKEKPENNTQTTTSNVGDKA